ncbi:TetR family transcriptional regulator [Paenibacillus sp. CCS19]|uniref:TetR/AcrR family transcriptional regulator n=1 Tax=Paenibacillus sp. CCS19 TaxID=3158387 RepID=UPI00295EF581|nr:TetR family transcriptional regulator [Paenibacillus cellulosilyticus]
MSGENDSSNANERRELVMQIALRRFAKDGYHATKISDIVAEAGVAQGTFYWYFKSKEAVALEIVKEGRQQLLDVIAQGYRRDIGTVQDMVQASEALLTRLFQFAESNAALMELLLGGGGGVAEAVRQAIAETRAAMENAFVQNIRRAIELGMLPEEIDAEIRAALIMSLIEGIISRWLFRIVPSESITSKSAGQLAYETARFEFFGLLGI